MLLDALVEGLKRLPETELPVLPRMADFALWATACETALWPTGTFWSAYVGNRDAAVEDVIEADPVAAAVRGLMDERAAWSGTASDLLEMLSETVGERVAKSKTWPANPRALSGRLRRAATVLRKVGIEIDHARKVAPQPGSFTSRPKGLQPGQIRPGATVCTVCSVCSVCNVAEYQSWRGG